MSAIDIKFGFIIIIIIILPSWWFSTEVTAKFLRSPGLLEYEIVYYVSALTIKPRGHLLVRNLLSFVINILKKISCTTNKNSEFKTKYIMSVRL